MKRTRRLAAFLIALFALGGLAACNSNPSPPAPTAPPTVEYTDESSTEAHTAPETEGVTETSVTDTVPSDTLPDEMITSPAEPETQPPPDEEEREELVKLRSLLSNKTQLRFDANGQFKIMMLSDLHMYGSGLLAEGMNNVKLLVEHEKPDLIILNGDNIADETVKNEEELRNLLKELTDYFEKKGIYWIHVYGNHDTDTELSLLQQQRVYESYDHCLSKGGDVRRCGVGNYVVPLYGSRDENVKFVIWALNSGSYLSEKDKNALFPDGKTPFPGNAAPTYDYIHASQIEWYVETSKLLQEQNGGEVVPSLMAFHIPLQETYTAWINRNGLEWTGQKGGDVGASPYNSGFFDVIRRRGDVKAIVNGHDHTNDFMVEYAGIKLCYCSTASTNPHHDASILGTRIFVIRESDPHDVETYMSYVKDLK